MISIIELRELAAEKKLLVETVEKDYVIGWLLMGIARHSLLRQWIFKGGTCLKKCFFETYRFSEDLDFTVPADMPYEAELYRAALLECTEQITEETGIEFDPDGIEINESHNKQNRLTFQGKVPYNGPRRVRHTRSLPKIKIDLTRHEVIAEAPKPLAIHHPYSDKPTSPPSVLCYTVNEILAEKTRAIYERQGRARDLFDVVNINRNYREAVDGRRAHAALEKKFVFKQLPTPEIRMILERVDGDFLKANWNDQLGHQLPVLPPVESYLQEFEESSLWWLEPRISVTPPPAIRGGAGERTIPREFFPQPGSSLGPSSRRIPATGAFELIRYAARNRLCALITYKGVQRLAEPYSLRTPRTGNLLLYVHELQRGPEPSGTTKAYKVDEIHSVQITNTPFQARYMVEL